MSINRAPFNALIDDNGTNTTGSIWNKAAIQNVLLDPIDAMGGNWTTQAWNAANYFASAGAWTVPAGTQAALLWAAHTRIVEIQITLAGLMSISSATTSLYLALQPPIPSPSIAVTGLVHYYLPGGVTGTGYIDFTPGAALRFLRDAGGTPWPVVTNSNTYLFCQMFWPTA